MKAPKVGSSSISSEIQVQDLSITWTAGFSKSILVIDSLRKTTEDVGQVDDFMCIFNCQGLGCGLSSAIIEQIKEDMPSVQINSVCLTLPFDSGVSSINKLLAIQYGIEYSTSVILRDYTDAIEICKEYQQKSDLGVDIRNVHCCIAADLAAALTLSSGQDFLYSSWYHTLSTPRHKFVDIRSSLWRYISFDKDGNLSMPNARRRAPHIPSPHVAITPLRAMMINVHSLHNCKALPNQHSGATLETVAQSNVVTLQSATSRNKESTDVRLADMDALMKDNLGGLLKWAAPGVHFKSLQSSAGPILPPSAYHSGGVARAHETGLAQDRPERVDYAIGFRSPYARSSVESLCVEVERLCSRRAYVHR